MEVKNHTIRKALRIIIFTESLKRGVCVSDYDGIERRSGKDRRLLDVPWYQQLFTRGNRIGVRREDDRRRPVCLDRYGKSLFVVIMAIVGLSLLDGLLTLILVAEHGAQEMNPILAVYLDIGTKTFLFVKYMLTVASIFILLLYKEAIAQRFRSGRFSFIMVALVFGSVIVWEVYLFMRSA